MAHDRLHVLNTIAETRVMHLFHHRDPDIAMTALDAIALGGGRVVEFTNRVRFAPAVFEAVRRHAEDQHPEMILGVGSVEDAATAAHFIGLGADFIVSPILVDETAALCNRRKIAYLPGAMTITEIAAAETLGVEFVKLYPAMDPMFIAAVQMPRPWSRIVANGPIGPDTVQTWLQAGAVAVGTMASVPADALANGRYDDIQTAVQALTDAAIGATEHE